MCDRTPTVQTGYMEQRPIELIGVYAADGGVLGELRYVLGKARGTAHCALCDITHGLARRKSSWDRACEDFDIPIRLVHLNERSSAETAACTLGTPTILARWADGGITAIMGPDDLEVNGSVSIFFERLSSVVARP